MSQQLINHSPDLKKLRDEGYDIEVQSGYLIMKSIPYVNSRKEVQKGMLVSSLTLAGDKTVKPDTHVIFFVGEHPCKIDGSEIIEIKNSSGKNTLNPGLIIDHTFSSKPLSGFYVDYYEKMTTYAAIISSPAHSIDPSVTPRNFAIIEAEEQESVFNYIDIASSRAEINVVSQRLELNNVAIVGLGGTGSYLLDLIAKTPIKTIHLFDGDYLLSHNAFRAPGAPSIDELRKRPKKVEYFREQYSKMRRNIVAHDYYINASNVEELKDMVFVFLCLDKGDAKKLIVQKLEEKGVPFIDVGMGIDLIDGSLAGVLRITTSTDIQRDHVQEKGRIPFTDGSGNNEYSKNIQIADLNSLNASLAVQKWKKMYGFYRDLENEYFSTYTTDGNIITNEDQP